VAPWKASNTQKISLPPPRGWAKKPGLRLLSARLTTTAREREKGSPTMEADYAGRLT